MVWSANVKMVNAITFVDDEGVPHIRQIMEFLDGPNEGEQLTVTFRLWDEVSG